LINVLDRAFGHPLELEEKATAPFAGGILQHGYQCGMIWGATLAAGGEAFRQLGSGSAAETAAILATGRLVETFRARHGEINCYEITEIDRTSSNWEMISYFLLKGGTIGCFKMASWYAPLALEAIESALAEAVQTTGAGDGMSEDGLAGSAGTDPDGLAGSAGTDPDALAGSVGSDPAGGADEALPAPVSCAAMTARAMGASDRHATMASGLAGGIGLCGGACGALGAALWLLGMMIHQEEGKKVGYKDPRLQKVIDRFLKQTDYRFECVEIVGRTFEDVCDHAEYLREGGCGELMGVLAAE
jgi:hypothetical protein